LRRTTIFVFGDVERRSEFDVLLGEEAEAGLVADVDSFGGGRIRFRISGRIRGVVRTTIGARPGLIRRHFRVRISAPISPPRLPDRPEILNLISHRRTNRRRQTSRLPLLTRKTSLAPPLQTSPNNKSIVPLKEATPSSLAAPPKKSKPSVKPKSISKSSPHLAASAQPHQKSPSLLAVSIALSYPSSPRSHSRHRLTADTTVFITCTGPTTP